MAAFEVLALDTATPQIRAPGVGDTYSFPRDITPSGANVTPFTISGYSLTGTNGQSLVDLSGTWNTTGTPTAVKLNVTDTASNASSLLLDLQIGGSSRFSVRKSGATLATGSTASAPAFAFLAESNTGIYRSAANRLHLTVGGNSFGFCLSNGFATVRADWGFGFSSSAADDSGTDVVLRREAADTLAQRRATAAQTSRIYGTYSDDSNYRRLAIAMTNAGVASIAPQGAGTGASGNVLHISGLPTSNPGPGILWNNGGVVNVGT